jgi:hypothetical protein
MRNLLIATAALSLIGGAAFAQNSSMTTPSTDSPNAQVPAGVGQGGQSAGGTMPANADGTPSTPPATASDSSMSSTGTTDTTSAPAPADGLSSAMASAAPESYPVCTSKHEDKCVNRSQATRTAMVHHRVRSHTTTSETQPSGM